MRASPRGNVRPGTLSGPVRVRCALGRLELARPAGAERYALAVVDALRRSGRLEVVEDPAASAPAVLSLDGRFRSAPMTAVTVVDDLGHLFRRSAYQPRDWLAQNWRVASAARRSDAVLVPSDAVRSGLESRLRLAPARAVTFEILPGPTFRRPQREDVAALRRALGLPPRYLLFVGTRSRRKNLRLLARAWARARPRLGDGAGLVLAGKGAGTVAGSRDLGYVDLERLPLLLAGAVAFVSPSFYEGSAIGALEAIACGTPPIVSLTGAPPRAVDRAGIILDADDEEAWAESMVALAAATDLRPSLAAAGLKTIAERRAQPPSEEALVQALTGA
ncbi:MAG: glycosyltransferase [Candidatus Dormibacteraeota bacterium]|nr:glycosyltransferase [Candidatus Dormibacteraeota bacterium]